MVAINRLFAGAVHPFRVALALQGGGAHGAFTWGVLDRLLEEPGLEVTGVSGASAGAVNAVVLASGWASGGPGAARERLERFWRALGQRLPPVLWGPREAGAAALDFATHLFSPYELNPLGFDPLRALLEELVDFPLLRRRSPMPLLVAATRVRTGTARIFREHELTVETVLASACLPQIHHAVTIDGEPYWDGGFSANPPVLALAELSRGEPLLVVRLSPAEIGEPPSRAGSIRQRVAQLGFGRPLADELAQLERLREAAKSPLVRLVPRLHRLARLDLQLLDGGEVLGRLDPATKILPDAALLEQLRGEGRAAAARWLEGCRGAKAGA